jgi:hypothetical protein
MSFLDPKQRVIDLELTSYGRHMLSTGRFKPASYAFFDGDIIYDQRFAQSSSAVKSEELQNEIEGRIQESTPRIAPQSIYRGSEVGVSNENLAYSLMPGVLAKKANKVNLAQSPEKSYILSEPIGNSAFNSKNIAAWDIGFFKAQLSSSNPWWTGSNNDIPTAFIPQLECDIQYHIDTYQPNIEQQNSYENWKSLEPEFEGDQKTAYSVNAPIFFENQSYMIYKDDFALLKVEEVNTEFLKENFELEVYRHMPLTGTGGKVIGYSETLEKLYFEGDDVPDTSRVDYYFDIDIDFEIDEAEYCELRTGAQDKIKNIYNDKVFNCRGRKETLQSLNIYATKENQEPEDVC